MALAVSLSSRAVGWPIFVLSLAGMWRLWARGARDRLGVLLLSWGVTWLVFVSVVMMAPVDERFQRYAVEFLDRVNYTLSPAFVILASLAGAKLVARRPAMARAVFERGMGHPAAALRMQTLDAFAATPLVDASRLLGLLRDPDAGVRTRAAELLWRR